MRTRTLRWSIVVGAFALPFVGVLELVDLARTPPAPPPPATPSCLAAEQRAAYDVDGAAAAAEKLRRDGPAEADRVCAAALLHRIRPPTVADRVVEVVERTANRVSRALASGREVGLADDPSGAMAGALLAAHGALVLIGLGQFFLWRAERFPPPVQVAPVDPPKDDDTCTGLAQIMRDRLARAGVAPGTSVPGELRAVVVDAVETGAKAGSTWLGDLLAAVGRVLAPSTGVSVTAKAFRNAQKRCAVTVEATVTRTNANVAVFTVESESYEDAAIEAAYCLYLVLIGQPPVRVRTPIWLSWTSPSALRTYHDALRKRKRGDFVGAASSLEQAAEEEPANVLVLILRSQALWQVYTGSPEDNVLRGGTQPVDYAVRAVECALDAVLRAPGNDDALFLAGILLSYAEHWAPAWHQADRRHRARVCALLQQVFGREPGFGPDGTPAEVEAGCREAARALLRRAVAHQRLWNVLRLALPLATRREAVDRVWPLSVLRFRRRHAAAAIVDGVEWDRLRRGRAVRDARTAYGRQVVVSAVRRGRVRAHLRVAGDRSGVIQWNLACAYAGQARLVELLGRTPVASGDGAQGRVRRFLRRSLPGTPNASGDGAKRLAHRFLRRSLLAASHRLTSADLDDFVTMPDFRTAGTGTDGPVEPYLEPVAVLLLREGAEARRDRVWGEQVDVVRATAQAALAAWTSRCVVLDRIAVPDFPAQPTAKAVALPSRAEAAQWFQDDWALWRALATWAERPERTAARLAVERLTPGRAAQEVRVPEAEARPWTAELWQAVCAAAGAACGVSESAAAAARLCAIGATGRPRDGGAASRVGELRGLALPAGARWALLHQLVARD